MAKGTIDDHSIATFMKAISKLINIKDTAITSDLGVIDDIVKSVSGVHIDYWNDSSLSQYVMKLEGLKDKIEKIKDETIDKSDSKAVYTSRSGQQFYYEIIESDETEMFREVLAGTIEDFEGLGKNDLIAVLLDEVERILKDEK